MRKPFFMLVLAAVLGLSLTSFVAWARPQATNTLLVVKDGEPTNVGVLVSAAGANVTNASTGTPFVITTANVPLRVITVQCDATAFVGFGGVTCGTTLATSAGCFRLGATDAPKVIILQDATSAMNAAGPAAFNCVVSKLL